eukprot:g3576.t1
MSSLVGTGGKTKLLGSSSNVSKKEHAWERPLPHDGESTILPTGEKCRIATTWSDEGIECHEEYFLKTDKLHVRKWREKTGLGSWSPWYFEVGSATSSANAKSGTGQQQSTKPTTMFSVSRSRNPEFVPQDDRAHFLFRVRNIPYPESTYNLSIDEKAQQVVLRTTNKKYFKKFKIPQLLRLSIKLDASNLSLEHSTTNGIGTLIIKYKKPDQVRRYEMQNRLRRKKKLKDPKLLQEEQCKAQ